MKRIALFLFLCGALRASAQELVPVFETAGPAESSTDTGARMSLSFEAAPLDQVLQIYGDLTGRTVIPNPGVNANITLKGADLTADEARQAIETSLGINNVGLVPVGTRFFKVVPAKESLKEGLPFSLADGERPPPESDRMISQIVTLRYSDVAEVQKMIQPLLSRNGTLAVLERAGALMISDAALNVKRILEVIGYVDQPGIRIEPRVYPLQHAKAEEIAAKLNELIEISKEKAVDERSAQAQQPMMPFMRLRRAAEEAAGGETPRSPATREEPVRQLENEMISGFAKVVSDARTNVLIVFTKEANFAFFDRIVNVLDTAVEPEVTVEVIALEYAKAEEIAAILNEFVGAVAKTNKEGAAAGGGAARTARDSDEPASQRLNEFARNRQAVAEAAPEAAARIGRLSENTRILADPRTNSLLLMGSRSDLAALKQVINGLDVMLAQVLIETVILEVGLNENVSSGISWIKENGTKNQTVAGWNVRDPLPQDLSATPLALTTNLNFSTGFSYYAFLSDLDLQAVINFAATDGNTRILSTPVVLTTDNTEAKIIIGEERPVVTSTGISTSGNDFSRYEYKNIGINLTVTPQINPQRYVVMKIEQSADQVGDTVTIDRNEVPIVLKREIKASIAVQDRSTVVLGGLINTEKRKTGNRIPLLGDIPLLGRLFRADTESSRRSELLVLMTPYVLTTPQEAREATRRVREASEAGATPWPTGWSESEFATPEKLEAGRGLRFNPPPDKEAGSTDEQRISNTTD